MEREKGSFRYLLVLYVILVVLTSAVVFFTYPIMKKNIEESGIYISYLEWKAKKENRTESYTVALYSGPDGVYVERSVERATDDMHSIVEALLTPLSDSEKEEGYTSYIPEGTSLIGISSADGYFFLELSSSFLSSLDITRSAEQIKKTLESYYPLESLTIICGAKIIRI